MHQVRHPALDAKLPAKLLRCPILLPGHHDQVIEVPEIVRQRLGQEIGVIDANSDSFQSSNGHGASWVVNHDGVVSEDLRFAICDLQFEFNRKSAIANRKCVASRETIVAKK
jgi:hypothetical protein